MAPRPFVMRACPSATNCTCRRHGPETHCPTIFDRHIPALRKLVAIGAKEKWENNWGAKTRAVTGCAGSWSTVATWPPTGQSAAPFARREIPTHHDAFAGCPR
jgi:hypothetical protein